MLDRIEGWPREVAALRALSVAPPRRALKTSRAPCRRDSIGYARSAVRPDAERWLWENDERPWEDDDWEDDERCWEVGGGGGGGVALAGGEGE